MKFLLAICVVLFSCQSQENNSKKISTLPYPIKNDSTLRAFEKDVLDGNVGHGAYLFSHFIFNKFNEDSALFYLHQCMKNRESECYVIYAQSGILKTDSLVYHYYNLACEKMKPSGIPYSVICKSSHKNWVKNCCSENVFSITSSK